MRWVVGLSVLGFLASVGLTMLSWRMPVPPMPLVYGLFAGIFVTFAAAVMGHPAKKLRGTEVHVSWLEVVKSVPLWVNLAVAAVLVYFVMTVLTTSAFAGGGSFEINAAALRGRPERTRLLAALYMAFYAISAQIAVSAMRWWSRWASGTLP